MKNKYVYSYQSQQGSPETLNNPCGVNLLRFKVLDSTRLHMKKCARVELASFNTWQEDGIRLLKERLCSCKSGDKSVLMSIFSNIFARQGVRADLVSNIASHTSLELKQMNRFYALTSFSGKNSLSVEHIEHHVQEILRSLNLLHVDMPFFAVFHRTNNVIIATLANMGMMRIYTQDGYTVMCALSSNIRSTQ